MEEVVTPKACMTSLPRPPTLAMQDNSHVIAKLKPKIRIVHIFTPEIIETDVANFRQLVQRLTGKPTKRQKAGKQPTKRIGHKRTTRVTLPMTINGEAVPRCDQAEAAPVTQRWHLGLGCEEEEEEVKRDLEEEARELWVESRSGGFLREEFREIDGFLQSLSDLPLLPLSSSHMDVIGEPTDS